MTKRTVLYFIASVLCTGLWGQYKNVEIKPLKSSYANYELVEQIDLETNHEFYLAGENIWMAINTYDATLSMPVTLSSIVYVELYTQDNQVVAQQKVNLEKGSGTGYIQIPKTLQTNYYYLRAYTNYMKNYGPSFYYNQRLEIVNPFYPVFNDETEEDKKADTTFKVTPEGGKLIGGIENKVVYSAKLGGEYCHEIAGRIVDDSDSVITRTNSDEGIGSFWLNPSPGKNYRFEALACGKKISVDLPLAGEGHNAILLDSLVENKAYLNLIATEEQLKNLKIQVMNNGIQHESDFLPQNQSTIQLALSSGINYIQMITPRGEILASSYVSVKEHDHFNISLDAEQIQLKKRQPLTLKLKANDEKGTPVPCKLNVSVSMDKPANHEGKQTKRWEYIQSVNMQRLFPNTATVDYKSFLTRNNLLNDYLTTRAVENLKHDYKPSKRAYPAELDKDIISGQVINMKTEKRAVETTIFQSFIDTIARLSVDVTDSEGRFLIELPEGFVGEDMMLVVNDTVGEYKITMDNEFSDNFLKLKKESFSPDKSLKDLIQKRMVNLQIQDAYNLNDRFEGSGQSDLRFYGYPDQSYKFDDYIELPNMEEFVFEVVSHATIIREDDHFHIYVLSERNDNIVGNSPLYLIDGVPVFDKNMFSDIPPASMESFHIVANKYYYKSLSFDGIIDITSKKGDFSDFSAPKNSLRTSFVPLQGKVTKASLDSLIQDKNIPLYQTTLYFNSDIATNKSGEAEIQLYAPDNLGRYSVTINGYDEKGRTGYARFPGYIEVHEGNNDLSQARQSHLETGSTNEK